MRSNTQRKNKGWFRPGHDPRRHQLTQAERQLGGRVFAALYIAFEAGTTWPRDAKKKARAYVQDLK